jgi:hypothetical protein
MALYLIAGVAYMVALGFVFGRFGERDKAIEMTDDA